MIYSVTIGQGLNKMSNYYIEENDLQYILKKLKSDKKDLNSNLINSLEFQNSKINNSNPKYILAAQNFLLNNVSNLYDNEDLIIDSDALVSENSNGAYVQCWVWVNKEVKGKKNKRKL